MSTTCTAERFRDRSPAPHALEAIPAAWRSFLRRREERRALLWLWRLGPRLVRDAGLDPDAVRAAVGGGWDDLRPNGLLPLVSEPRPDRR